LLCLRTTDYTGTAAIRKTSKMTPIRLIDKLVKTSIKWDKPIKKIGLDGKGVCKRKQIFNITNLSDREIIGILPNLTQQKLTKELLKIDKKLRLEVKEVCIDMDRFFIRIIKDCFPNAKIVIDHFHVIQHIIRLVKDQRKMLEEIRNVNYPINQLLGIPPFKLKPKELNKLNYYLEKETSLQACYYILNEVRKIYLQSSYKKAYKQLNHVIRLCRLSKVDRMIDLSKTLERWLEKILNFHISRTTNAFTEGIHNHFERIKRNHFGVRNIERFCKRLLFSLLPMSIFVDIFVQRC